MCKNFSERENEKMSKVSKMVSLLLVVVMVVGVALTAVAAESAKAKTDEEKAQEVASQVSSDVQSEGSATVAAITDTATLAKAYDMSMEADATLDSIEGQFTEKPQVIGTLLFDVSGVTSGDVTIKASSSYANKLAIASHYNTKTGQVEVMKDLVQFDAQGRATVSFSSYSPVMIKVLNVTRDALKADATVGVKSVNLAAPQVDASNAKTAKMGE